MQSFVKAINRRSRAAEQLWCEAPESATLSSVEAAC